MLFLSVTRSRIVSAGRKMRC